MFQAIFFLRFWRCPRFLVAKPALGDCVTKSFLRQLSHRHTGTGHCIVCPFTSRQPNLGLLMFEPKKQNWVSSYLDISWWSISNLDELNKFEWATHGYPTWRDTPMSPERVFVIFKTYAKRVCSFAGVDGMNSPRDMTSCHACKESRGVCWRNTCRNKNTPSNIFSKCMPGVSNASLNTVYLFFNRVHLQYRL